MNRYTNSRYANPILRALMFRTVPDGLRCQATLPDSPNECAEPATCVIGARAYCAACGAQLKEAIRDRVHLEGKCWG